MHARFRPIGGRLVVALEVWRGKPSAVHLGTLGRVPLTLTAAQRGRFWAELDGRLRAINCLISDTDRRRVIAEIRVRIPPPTRRELREVTEHMARQIEAFSETRAA